MACLLTQTRLDGTDLDIAAGLPGRPHAPAPVSNTVQPLRSPHPGAAQAAGTAARSPRLTAAMRAPAGARAGKSGKARKLERPSAELGPHGTQTALQKALFDVAGRQGHRGLKFSGRLARMAKPAQVVRQGRVP
jgi:hypothetical protein